MLDYETLRLIWWALLGILLIGFAVMDGFDLGTAVLLPFVARTDEERRVAINSVGPVWEGNQVWFILVLFILGGGAIFAAWPPLYAAAFSGFYLAMFLILWALILRPVGFKFRGKIEDPRWRSFWDWCLIRQWRRALARLRPWRSETCSSACRSDSMRSALTFTISLVSLLSPFAVLVGLVSLSMIVLHGATWLIYKATGAVAAARATRHTRRGEHLRAAVRILPVS